MLSLPTRADEGGVSYWLPGNFGSLAAVPATPGWAFATVYLHNHATGGGGRTFQTGGGFQVGLGANIDLGLVSANYTFATPVLGGQLTVGLAAAAGRSSASVDATVTGPGGAVISGGRDDARWGFTDLFPLAQLKWNSGVHNYMIYTQWGVPIGTYDSGRLANLGIGHWAADAGFGYTYFNTHTGWEFSAVTGLTYNFENPDTNYQNGIDWHLDWGASYFIKKDVHVGLVGYFFQQLTADDGAPASLGDNKGRVIGIGPQIGFLFPVGDMHGYLNVKAYKDLEAENRASGWSAWVSFAVSQAPPKHEPTRHPGSR
jgi:hypothetical protein